MAPTVEAACNYVEHGHVRIGPQVVREINYHLKRGQEDYLTWTDGSVMQQKIRRYNNEEDA